MKISALATAALLLVAGCGKAEEEEQGGGKAETAPAVTTSTQATGPEAQPGGAGDEQPARTEITLVADGGSLSPKNIQVAAYLQVRIKLQSGDGKAHKLTMKLPDGEREIEVSQGEGSVVVDLPGLRPGSYTITSEAGARSRLRAVTNPGP